jgi:sn-glycerol 3-phosphate transport system substrate-binding protein
MRKFQSAVPSKQLPGLVMFDDTATQTMADSGVILPAQSCINADNYDMSPFLSVAQDYYRLNGTLWPASANIGNILVYYNKDHFRRAGLDPDKAPTTLAEVRDDAAKIKAAGVVSQPLVQAMESWKTEFWLTGDGSTVVDNDNGRGGGQTTAGNLADNPQALELFTWFKQMKDDGLMQAIPGTEGQVNQYLAMANQQASMMIETSSAATSVEAFLKGNLDTSKLGDLSAAEAQKNRRPGT